LPFSILNIKVHGPPKLVGPKAAHRLHLPLVGPEQKCNFNLIANGWARLATRCGWA